MSVSKSDITRLRRPKTSVRVISSYVLDWTVLVAIGIISYYIGDLEPHKRPFSLTDPNISLPYKEAEAVPLWFLGILIGAFPFMVILIVTFVLVPGSTTPRHTPASLVWRCKLWEFHTGTLGLLAANIIAFFFTQGMKNLFGKPRPDLLDRCQPDVDNGGQHTVSDFAGVSSAGQLYSASICQQVDSHILNDGFRSYPSGHSSASAAGLIYLSLFLASKFAVSIPFVTSSTSSKAPSHTAFPSHTIIADPLHDRLKNSSPGSHATPKPVYGLPPHHKTHFPPLRNYAAAPPMYLLAIVLAPFALSIYISASRWFDFRHHGFDILFGYLIGLVAAVYCFRLYHLPLSAGAGWAWGPRCHERAFWAGVGRTGYGAEPIEETVLAPEADSGQGMGDNSVQGGHESVSGQPPLPQRLGDGGDAGALGSRNVPTYRSDAYAANGYAHGSPHDRYDGADSGGGFVDVEMQRMDDRR